MKKFTVGLLLVLMLSAGCKNNKPVPTASPSVKPAATVTNTVIPAETEPTASPAPTAVPTPTLPAPTNWPTPAPTSQGTKKPLPVDADDAVILHLTVDTGIPQTANPVQKFDDFYQIVDSNALGDIDLSSVKMLVYVTDYFGNSAIYAFKDVQGIVYFGGFVLTSDGVPQSVSNLAFFDIFVDNSATAQLSWGGKKATCAPEAEQSSPTVMTGTAKGKTITITVTNMDVKQKDKLLLY